MNKLKLFQSPNFGQVRTVVINGQVMFAATDVAKCLGYVNPQKAIRNHCKPTGVNEMDTPTNGGIQKVRFITKGNVIRLVASSELPQAEQVESWIFDEVIPNVLETGGYISTSPNDTPEEIMARALTIAQDTLAKREERLKQLESKSAHQQVTIELQEKEIKEAAPKVNYYNNHLQSVNTLTSTQVAKQIGMDAEKLHKKLKETGILYKQSGQWLLHSPYSTWGLHSTRTQTYTRNDGALGTSIYTVWTEKGRRFIISLYENEWNVRKAINQIKGDISSAV